MRDGRRRNRDGRRDARDFGSTPTVGAGRVRIDAARDGSFRGNCRDDGVRGGGGGGALPLPAGEFAEHLSR